MAEEESGLDELLRLSQKFTRQAAEDEAREKQRLEQGKKVRGVLRGLKDLNISMALTQLQEVAEPAVIKRVEALKTGEGTDDLRKLITSLSDSIERRLGSLNPRNADTGPLVNSMRTLNILLDLYFSLQ
mgnify:CR=1 FL=1